MLEEVGAAGRSRCPAASVLTRNFFVEKETATMTRRRRRRRRCRIDTASLYPLLRRRKNCVVAI